MNESKKKKKKAGKWSKIRMNGSFFFLIFLCVFNMFIFLY